MRHHLTSSSSRAPLSPLFARTNRTSALTKPPHASSQNPDHHPLAEEEPIIDDVAATAAAATEVVFPAEVSTSSKTAEAYDAEQSSELEDEYKYTRQATAMPSSPLLPPPPLSSSNNNSNFTAAWITALSIVFAARLGRLTSNEVRLDVRRLQRDRERGRALSTDLRQQRDQWRLEEAARMAGEDGKRVEEAVSRAREETRRQAEAQKRIREEAVEAAARLTAERNVARKEYETQQALLDAEYKQRVAKEQQLLEEARQKELEAEEARRREAEERRQQAALERQQREEEERRAAEEAVRVHLEERRRLEQEKKRFAIRIEGVVVVHRPPPGTLLPGPLNKHAVVRITTTAGSLLGGGQGTPDHTDFGSVEEAVNGAAVAVSAAVRTACDAAASAMRLQAMTGAGAMATMEQPEQDHWIAVTVARSVVAALECAETALHQFRQSTSKQQECSFQLRTEVGVLPPDHPQRPERVLAHAIALVEGGEPKRAVTEILQNCMDTENEAFYKDLSPNPSSSSSSSTITNMPATLGSALELAHFLNRMLYERPARSSDAPAWFEGAVELVRSQLRHQLVAGAPEDSLERYADVLSVALGPQNPVAVEAVTLAAANVSVAEKTRRAERERARQAEFAAKLLEEEWPDAEEIRAARIVDSDAKTPIAERVWALRNVAGTLAMGGPGERGRARQLLEQAVKVKQQFSGAPDHPGVLPELAALAEVLESSAEWSQDAAAVATLTLRVLGNIAAAYSQIGDHVSAALVMESGLRRWEEAAGERSPAVRAATRRADQLLEVLTPDQRSLLATKRGEAAAVLATLSEALTEQLGAYQDGSTRSKVQEWDERGAAMLGPLL